MPAATTLRVVPLAMLAALACSSSTAPGPRVEENGLTREINELVSESFLETLESLGLPIHRGATPPTVEGVYNLSPFTLVSSTVPNDPSPGSTAPAFYAQFTEQNNTALTVLTDYANGPERGDGLGSFIVGSDGNFSVFAALTVKVQEDSALSLVVISGRPTAIGMTNAYVAVFMLDDYGDPGNYFIANETGRIFRDSDGISQKIAAIPSTSGTSASPGLEIIRSVVSGRD